MQLTCRCKTKRARWRRGRGCASPEFFQARTIGVSAGGGDARAILRYSSHSGPPLAGHRTEPGRFRAQEQAKREQESESLHAGQTAYRNRIWTRDFQASFISHSHKRAAQSASSAARSLPMAEDPRLLIATTDAGSALYAGVDGQPNGRAPCLIRFSTSLALHGLEALSEELARNLKNSCAQPTLLQSVRHGCQFERDHARRRRPGAIWMRMRAIVVYDA